MNVYTGETVYEQVLSLDSDNNPISATTFDYQLFLNDAPFSGGSINYSLTDPIRAIFTFSWSTDIFGSYQLYVKNNVTNVIFISDTVNVGLGLMPDIYVGL